MPCIRVILHWKCQRNSKFLILSFSTYIMFVRRIVCCKLWFSMQLRTRASYTCLIFMTFIKFTQVEEEIRQKIDCLKWEQARQSYVDTWIFTVSFTFTMSSALYRTFCHHWNTQNSHIFLAACLRLNGWLISILLWTTSTSWEFSILAIYSFWCRSPMPTTISSIPIILFDIYAVKLNVITLD